jgi:hypothetical protein
MILGDEPGRFSDFFQGYYLQKKKSQVLIKII